MNIENLKKLWVHELKDLYNAEHQILDAMPSMLEAAQDEDLKNAFRSHEKTTRKQVSRLEKIFETLEFEPRGHHCAGMEGLIKEANSVIKSISEPDVRDAALVAASQRIEHYEMAGYGVARTFAEKLGEYDAADLLQESLNEESMADQRLTRLAERKLNFEAMSV